MCKIFTCVVAAICCIPQILLSQGYAKHINPDDLYEIHRSVEAEKPPEWMERQVNPSPAAGPTTEALKTNACASTFNMSTPYNSNNGQRGCMFDVLAANAVTIRCFESNTYAGTTANYEIYYRAGTHVGFENNAANWTFLGGATGITSAGNNLPTALPIPVNVTIPAGQRYSFYITNDFGGGTSYTDGTAVGNFLAADANITVYEGVGKSYPFGLTFNVRNFNGTIYYDGGVVLDGTEALLRGETGEEGALLKWEIPSSTDYEAFSLERSADGHQFEQLVELPLEKTGSYVDSDLLKMGTAVYRLRMQGKDGSWTNSEALELQLDVPGSFALQNQWPNPFKNGFACEINSRHPQMVHMELLDQMGRIAHVEDHMLEKGMQTIEVTPQSLAKGVYFLRLVGADEIVTRRLSNQ